MSAQGKRRWAPTREHERATNGGREENETSLYWGFAATRGQLRLKHGAESVQPSYPNSRGL